MKNPLAALVILSLSIEGLSKSAKIAPIVDAGDVAYEDGTPIEVLKPATPNATAGAPDDSPVGGTTAAKVIDALLALGSVTEPDQIVAGAQALITRTQNHALALYDAQLLGEARKARWERLTHLDGIEVATRVRQEITERIDGSAYFGGGLSSGTLKNEGTSSTVDPAAFIIVGPFASNGEPVNVNMSAAFTHSYNCDPGTGGITGAGGGTVTLEWSSDGTSWNLLTSIGVNETERLVVVDGDPVVPDFVSWSMAAAGTYTWTPGALSGVHIRLSWTSFSEPTLLGTTIINTEKSQRTSVIAVEQP